MSSTIYWEFWDGDSWKRYADRDSTKLESCFQRGESNCSLGLYSVDIPRLTQTNTNTKFRRRVRRFFSGDPGARWQFKDESEVWREFDLSTSSFLEVNSSLCPQYHKVRHVHILFFFFETGRSLIRRFISTMSKSMSILNWPFLSRTDVCAPFAASGRPPSYRQVPWARRGTHRTWTRG